MRFLSGSRLGACFLLLHTLCALLLRLAFINDCELVTYDGAYYLRYFFGEKSWSSAFPPGYPALVAVLNWFAHDEVLAARLVSCLFGSALIVPTYLLLRRHVSTTLSLLLVSVVAFHPALIRFSTQELSDISYCFFWLLGILLYHNGRFTLSASTGAIAYLIRPEGLLLSVFVVLSTLFRREYRSAILSSATTLVIVVLFVLYNHARTGDWIITGKTENVKVFHIDDWQKNEIMKGQEPNGSALVANLIDDYPNRLGVLAGYVAELSGVGLLVAGLSGLVMNPSVYWTIIIQFFLTGLSGANYDLGYGLSYLLVLVVCSGAALARIKVSRLAAVSALVCVILALAQNFEYAQNKYLLQPDERFAEFKAAGLELKDKYSDAQFMDRKPYLSFYAETKAFIEIPNGSPGQVLAIAKEKNVDFIVLHPDIIRIFRPRLIPLLCNNKNEIVLLVPGEPESHAEKSLLSLTPLTTSH